MKKLFLLTLMMTSIVVLAQNPISPPGYFIADPEAHIAQDGKLYIYGSADESNDYWCSYTHHVLSTSDMLNWNIDSNAFSSKGENDEVAYSDKLLFAPDCAYKNGTYYLYFCSPGKTYGEGVATSSSPYGPFKNGKEIKGAYQIDPAVLVDGDDAYFYWGQAIPKVARLKPNMTEIDSTSTLKLGEGTILDKNFHEGSSIRKIGNQYYLVFADHSRRNRPTCLGYAISNSPMGPFEYKGIIIDNYGCDPEVWNNHGSIQEYNGQWYVFYHRSSNGSRMFRKACVEPIKINKDGSIDEVEMSSQGAGPALDAFSRIEAEWTCGLTGKVRSMDFGTRQGKLGKIEDGNTAKYKFIDFGKGASQFVVKILGKSAKGKIEIWLDDFDGEPIGTCEIPGNDGSSPYQVVTSDISSVKGEHVVYLKFISEVDDPFEVDWLSFNR